MRWSSSAAAHDPKDDRTRRSHLGLLVTRRVNKIVLLPGPQGPRLGRRHRGPQEHEPRAGQQRRPLAQHARHQRLQPVHPRRSSATRSSARSASCTSWTASGASIREARSATNPEWTWEYNALLFATDPVAMDHVEWDIIDAKRKEKGLPPVGAVGKVWARPAQARGVRHPPAPAHPPGRQPRPGDLRLQLAQGETIRDPASGHHRGLTPVRTRSSENVAHIGY